MNVVYFSTATYVNVTNDLGEKRKDTCLLRVFESF